MLRRNLQIVMIMGLFVSICIAPNPNEVPNAQPPWVTALNNDMAQLRAAVADLCQALEDREAQNQAQFDPGAWVQPGNPTSGYSGASSSRRHMDMPPSHSFSGPYYGPGPLHDPQYLAELERIDQRYQAALERMDPQFREYLRRINGHQTGHTSASAAYPGRFAPPARTAWEQPPQAYLPHPPQTAPQQGGSLGQEAWTEPPAPSAAVVPTTPKNTMAARRPRRSRSATARGTTLPAVAPRDSQAPRQTNATSDTEARNPQRATVRPSSAIDRSKTSRTPSTTATSPGSVGSGSASSSSGMPNHSRAVPIPSRPLAIPLCPLEISHRGDEYPNVNRATNQPVRGDAANAIASMSPEEATNSRIRELFQRCHFLIERLGRIGVEDSRVTLPTAAAMNFISGVLASTAVTTILEILSCLGCDRERVDLEHTALDDPDVVIDRVPYIRTPLGTVDPYYAIPSVLVPSVLQFFGYLASVIYARKLHHRDHPNTDIRTSLRDALTSGVCAGGLGAWVMEAVVEMFSRRVNLQEVPIIVSTVAGAFTTAAYYLILALRVWAEHETNQPQDHGGTTYPRLAKAIHKVLSNPSYLVGIGAAGLFGGLGTTAAVSSIEVAIKKANNQIQVFDPDPNIMAITETVSTLLFYIITSLTAVLREYRRLSPVPQSGLPPTTFGTSHQV